MPKTSNVLISLLFFSAACVASDDGSDDGSDNAAATENANGDVADDDGDTPCVAGQSIACACPDGSMSAQTCMPDGSGYGECACGDDDDDDDDDPTTGDDDDDASPTTGGDDDDDDDMSDDSGDTGVEIPTYEDVVFVFAQSCGSSLSECHRREAFAADAAEDCRGWAAFEDDAIGAQYYAGPDEGLPTGCPDMDLMTRLLEVNSWQCGPGNPGPGLPLVVPGAPEESYIMMKIDGDVCMIAGEPSLVMPPPDSKIVISPENRAILEAWIAAGAPGPM